MTTSLTLAQLSGRGSFTFQIGGETFTGLAVPLGEYFSWQTVQESDDRAPWYAQHLAERHRPSSKRPVTIDEAWVLDHVRVHQVADLDNILLEEAPPGPLFARKNELTLGRVKFRALSYSLREYRAFKGTLDARGERPLDVRFDEAARALRVRLQSAGLDPATITADWVLEHLSKPALAGLERLLWTGWLPNDPEPPEEQKKSP